MANQTLSGLIANIFPDGTEVAAYEQRDIPDGHTGSPPAPPINTQTVAGGTVTFTGLTVGEAYMAAGQVSGVWRYLGFSVDAPAHTPVFTDSDETVTGDLNFTGDISLPPGTVDEDDLSFSIGTQAELDAHAADETAVHGIDNTADIAVMREAPLNVKYPEYGAVGDGVADDTTEIQAAIDAAFAAGGGEVFVPRGAFMCSGSLLVKAGVTLRGEECSTSVLRSTSGAAAAAMVRLYGDNDVTVENLTVDANSRTNSTAVNSAPAAGATVATRHTVRDCRIINSVNNAFRASNQVDGLRFEGSAVEDCTSGVSVQPATGDGSEGIHILGNRFRNVGLVNVQVYAGSAQGTYRFKNVVIANNELKDFATPSTAIPIEPTGIDGLVVSGNVISTVATRGISGGNNIDASSTGNVIKDQTLYAFEVNGGKRNTFTGNTTENCPIFLTDSGTVIEDLIIANNAYHGSGASGTVAGAAVVKLTAACKRVLIASNQIKDWDYLVGAVQLGSGAAVVEDANVVGNTFVVSSANTPIRCIHPNIAIRAVVQNNVIRVTRDLAAGDEHEATIRVGPNAASDKITVRANDIIFTGTVAAAANSSGIGSGNVGAGALTAVNITDNRVMGAAYGLRLRINSADLLTANNDTRTCTTADDPAKVPTTASAATVTLPVGPEIHTISGTTTITSVTAAAPGKRVVLIFSGALTFTDGSNLKLAGNFVTTADDTITLVSDGTNWIETARSVN